MRLPAGRRRFLQGLASAALAAFGVRRASAGQAATPASGSVAATWAYPWHEGLRSRNPVPRPLGVPADFVPAGDHRKHRTQHWVRPRDWPLGPAVQTQDGKVISVDFMIAKADFDRGFSWSLIWPADLREQRIDHVDVDLVPAGHAGFETAHYDIHVYFVPHSAHGACDL